MLNLYFRGDVVPSVACLGKNEDNELVEENNDNLEQVEEENEDIDNSDAKQINEEETAMEVDDDPMPTVEEDLLVDETPIPKVTPLRLGPLKNSPKRVHFSPEVEEREQIKEEGLSMVETTPKSSMKKQTNVVEASPPLKLKIKFGKDKSGTITHCKINEKAPDPDDAFYGFEESEICDWVSDDFSDYDLKTTFEMKPTVYVSISSKKAQKQVETEPKEKDDSEPPQLPVMIKSQKNQPAASSNTPSSKQEQAPIPKLILSVGNSQASISQSPSPSLSKRERRKKSDNLNFVKPLWDGWFREVVWRPMVSDPSKKDADVYYYPPNPPGQKTMRYKTTTELEAYLITSGSMYPISFFTFKKELVGGPEGWETERHVETPEKTLPVRSNAPLTTPLGKRVSKPPEKLIMETEVETPQRQSKRSSKPPDKFEVKFCR